MGDFQTAGLQTDRLGDEEDRRCLRAVAAGDDAALAVLRSRHAGGLLRFVRARVRDRLLAEELVADVFQVIWQQPSRYAAHASVRAWLFGIARRKLRDAGRRRGLLIADEADLLEVADPGPGPVETLFGQPSAHGLVRQVARMPAALRDVLVLAFDQRMTYEEIAEVLEVPVGTVRSRLHEARSRLRAYLAYLGNDGP